MSQKQRTGVFLTSVAVVVLLVTSFFEWGIGSDADYVHSIRKNIEVFGLVYQEISKKYVDPIDPDKFIKAGIHGMLETLDPYTVLVEQNANSHLQIITTGKYGGLGMKIAERDDWPTVADQPFEDDPAGKAGIREGDQIITINDENTKELSISEVAKRLRGEIGAPVTIEVNRAGESATLEFRLIRAEITIHDVSYTGIIEDEIGYVKLAGFSKNAGYEIRQAIQEMMSKGIKGLVLDLRNNPGGLLDAAVTVAENFIAQDELIVSTKGRLSASTNEYYSKKNPTLKNLPLIVLVNEFSASASEIVAGAIQDLDRGIIIGTPTFGKGLVQTVIPISREAALKVTTAKYYIPSGRLIQRADRLKNDKASSFSDANAHSTSEDSAADTTAQNGIVYRTHNGRKVFGGGGIKPDIVVESPKLSQYQFELKRKSMPFHFALTYANEHPDLLKNFEVTEEILAQFKTFLHEKNFSYIAESEKILNDFRKAAQNEGYLKTIEEKIDALEIALQMGKKDDFQDNKPFIIRELKMEISAKIFGTRAKVEAGFKEDSVLKEAIKVLKDKKQYGNLLTPANLHEG